jgi:hypothetical protein
MGITFKYIFLNSNCFVVQNKKVILFEELATQFGLKVPDTIDRLTVLVNEGRLTGT